MMKRIFFAGFGIMLLMGLQGGVLAQVKPVGNLPLDPAIKTGKLSNGFTYFIRKNNEPQHRATLYLVVKAGSILETDKQLGLAHFMEHMSFNGTKHYPKNELVEYLQKSGIRFGADLNAYTSFDETVYQLPIPTDDKALFNNGLQIMRDWAQEATLDLKDINDERGVVLEEKRLRKGAQNRMQDKTFPFQVNGSRYAGRMPIGTDQVLNHFNKTDILSFYKDWYRPDLQALIVVGDIDVNAVEKQVKALFGDLKNPAAEKKRNNYTIPLLNRNRFLTVTDPEVAETSVSITWKHPAITQGSESAYRTSLVQQLGSAMLSSRLNELSRTPGIPLLAIQGGYSNALGNLDALSVELTAKKDQLQQGFTYAWQQVQRIKRFGFTASEFERAKTAYQTQIQALLKEKDKQNSTNLADELKRHFLTGEPAPGIVYEAKLIDRLLTGISLAEVNRVVSNLVSINNRDIMLTAPESLKAGLPTEQTLYSWISEAEKNNISAYTENVSQTSLLEKQPVAGKVITEKENKALGIYEWTLSNGAKVILKPTTFKNDEIFFTAFGPGGTSLVSDADFESAANAAGIIASSGLGKHDPISLPKLLNGKQVSVSPFIAERWQGINGGSGQKDLGTALELVQLYFTSPRKDTAVFSNIISRSSEMIANRYSQPGNVFSDTVAAVLGSHNSRRTGPTLQKLNSIELDKALEIYKERFANAGGFTFVFTGSFTPESIKPLIETYIASLPSTGQTESAKDLGIRPPEGALTKTVYAGKEDKASVTLLYNGKFDSSPEKNMALSALQDVVEFHLLERLREIEGGVYSPSVKAGREKFPESRYNLNINFGCAPANVDRLVKAALEEVEKLKTDGPTATDMQKFSSEALRQLEISQQNNQFWLGYLSNKLQNQEDINGVLAQPELIKGLTADDIKAAAKTLLQDDHLIRLIWMPENK